MWRVGTKVRIREQCPVYALLPEPVGRITDKRPAGDVGYGQVYVEVDFLGNGEPMLLCVPPHQVSQFLEAA